MKKLILGISVLACLTNANSNPLEKALGSVTAHFAGAVQEDILKNSQHGKNADAVKKSYLNSIANGVKQLEQMKDPNIKEVYDLIDLKLKDNDLSMTDYNLISNKIHEHKVAINARNSNHSSDVQNFRKNMNNR